jgi:tRNA U38,U39,U40 pseudouridine synthase TruA
MPSSEHTTTTTTTATATATAATTAKLCDGCGLSFSSRNAVFKHLKDTDGSCLSKKDYENYIRFVKTSKTKFPKVVILYGYLPSSSLQIRNGQDAGKILLQTIHQLQNEIDGIDNNDNDNDNDNNDANTNGGDTTTNSVDDESSIYKINRSYGYYSRSAECVDQDKDTATQTEVMAVRLPPLLSNKSKGAGGGGSVSSSSVLVDDWLDQVQNKLYEKFQKQRQQQQQENNNDYCHVHNITPIRIFGRQDMPNSKFNAETDVTYRRVEYLLPVDLLTWSINDPKIKNTIQNLPLFAENHKHDINHVENKEGHSYSGSRPEDTVRLYMLGLKNKMKLLTTRIVKLDLNDKGSVMEKEFSLKNQKKNKAYRDNKKSEKKKKTKDPKEEKKEKVAEEDVNDNNEPNKGSTTTVPTATSDNPTKLLKTEGKKTNILKRKRYHNFTEKMMAHDYFAYRRLDRIYHRATMNFPMANHSINSSNSDIEGVSMDTEKIVNSNNSTRYIALSISGDLFLTGQICRIVGVLLALLNGTIDEEFVDCVFDEDYPHLVPTPPVPIYGMISSEVHYAKQEGKTKCILSPRVSNQYKKGWNKPSTLLRVKDWQAEVYKYIDDKWKKDGRDGDGRLNSAHEWTQNVLLPWAERAKRHLEDYKCWKNNQIQTGMESSTSDDCCPVANNTQLEILSSITEPTKSIDPAMLDIFQDVVYNLRKLDTSGEWPTTSSKRQLVMVSTLDDLKDNVDQKPESLSEAFSKAKRNEQDRSSAYSYVEGEGGASGSFSVGIMPGGIHKQPKANSMFPDLVKAAFELEVKLFPEREPSSTIAINRNAQFRPHTDSGAGAGQSTSLIVGLGTYSGGELMVEGEKHDIRYKGIEFDGWKQRHWTMPFNGERYSLVWFTPKGCEGMRGIDLDLK